MSQPLPILAVDQLPIAPTSTGGGMNVNFHVKLDYVPVPSPNSFTTDDCLALCAMAGFAAGLFLARNDLEHKSHYPFVGVLIGATAPISIPVIAVASLYERYFM
jgi:hypothetical protein